MPLKNENSKAESYGRWNATNEVNVLSSFTALAYNRYVFASRRTTAEHTFCAEHTSTKPNGANVNGAHIYRFTAYHNNPISVCFVRLSVCVPCKMCGYATGCIRIRVVFSSVAVTEHLAVAAHRGTHTHHTSSNMKWTFYDRTPTIESVISAATLWKIIVFFRVTQAKAEVPKTNLMVNVKLQLTNWTAVNVGP